MQVHQLHPSAGYGDAIGNQMLNLRAILQRQGYSSEIFAEHIDPRLEGVPRPWEEYREHSAPGNILLVHYSLAYEPHLFEFVSSLPDRKVLIYHNITPWVFFRDLNGPYFTMTRQGRKQLRLLPPLVEMALGDSEYNRRELAEVGFRRTGVLPIAFDASSYSSVMPDSRVTTWLSGEEWTNILFVGRLAPNKRFEDLISTFAYLKWHLKPKSRLLLVGTSAGTEEYEALLLRLVGRLGLADVHFLGHVSLSSLVAYYQGSHIFLSMSEHEGFFVPLLESMYFGLPVVAYSAPAVIETLGGAGVRLNVKDHALAAEAVNLVLEDRDFRDRIVTRQRERLKDFTLETVERRLLEYIEALSIPVRVGRQS
jgi:L-malate glycosyltransferase